MSYQGLAYASFSIAGDQMNPELWTHYFGLKPDIFVVKGEPFITPAGRSSRYPGRTNVWGVSSKLAVQSDSLEPHLRYLIELLALPRVDLREQMDRQQAHMRLFCYWANYTNDRIPHVPDDIRMMMDSMGGTVEIDEYR